MDEATQPRVPKWPFLLGDAILLGLAYFIYWQGASPLPQTEILAGGLCVILGAALAVSPFVMEYRALLKTIEVRALGSAMEKIQNLETLSAHIGSATSHWQLAHEDAEKTSAAAREIADRMAAEVKDFTEFMQKANDGERATLRLEVEKLRRTETDWLQTLIRVLDHIYALHLAAERSGQPQLAGQIRGFQNACRDTTRKLGLVPFAAAPAEQFDPKRHQTAGGSPPAEGAAIIETLATGYTFQGRQVRAAMVKLATAPGEAPVSEAADSLTTPSSQPLLHGSAANA